MITPATAPVRPRIVSPTTGDALLLEDFVLTSAARLSRGLIHLDGPTGSGKTTALRHLAATVLPHYPIVLMDEPELAEAALRGKQQLVVYTHPAPLREGVSRRIAPWNEDDFIEYLLARHPDKASGVFRRIRDAGDRGLAGGVPELWRVIIDRMAGDSSIERITDALLAAVEIACDELGDQGLAERFCEDFFGRRDFFREPSAADLSAHQESSSIPSGSYLSRLIRLPLVRTTVAAEHIARQLHSRRSANLLLRRLPRDLIFEVAERIRCDEMAIDYVQTISQSNSLSSSMAASLLHAAGAIYRPDRLDANLYGAYLERADFSGIPLTDADLRCSDLCEANLQNVVWNNVRADKADFTEADLKKATISHCHFAYANLYRADVQGATAWDVNFTAANLGQSNFRNSLVPQCRFVSADLREAVFCGASLQAATLTGADIVDADFRNVDFTKARLQHLCLRQAQLDGATFSQANLQDCDLENVGWDDARFDEAKMCRAYLTGTTFFRGDFRGADLRHAGMGDIVWEGADLREADLTGVSFHMGSTRCGLVDSPYPSEGTRTGFYTDDFDEQYFKSPHEIRKASLQGANFLGARTDGVDFYLVDLRRAIYDDRQLGHFRQCGAIL